MRDDTSTPETRPDSNPNRAPRGATAAGQRPPRDFLCVPAALRSIIRAVRVAPSLSTWWRGAAVALAALSLRCSVLVSFNDCSTDRDCRLGERCNPARRYCEVPVEERCNGIDDDHDDVSDADEDFGPCGAPAAGRCAQGRRRCVAGALVCRPFENRQEVCHNGVDDNCNGIVDDGANCVQNFPASMNFPIGSNDPNAGEGDDAPEHRVCIAAYTLDKHEVTNEAFLVWLNSLDPTRISVGRPATPLNRTFVYGTYAMYNDGTAAAPDWKPLVQLPAATEASYAWSLLRRGARFDTVAADVRDLPVVNVTWLAADRYCRWAGKQLPTEAEYFRAMRGDGGARTYPWGNDAPTCTRANVAASASGGPCSGRPVSVEALPGSRTPEGIFHLFGNVDEWMWDYLDTTPNHDRNNYYQSVPPEQWCMRFPNGPLGPAMGSPINEPGSTTAQRCVQCRFSRGRRYDSTDHRITIRKWMDADRGEPGIGFRCAAGGAAR